MRWRTIRERTCGGPWSSPSAAGAVSRPNPMVGAVVVARRRRRRRGLARGPGHRRTPRSWRSRRRATAPAAPPSSAPSSPATTPAAPPPCTHALIEAGVARVVVGAGDPNPVVDGAGVTRLREAGIEVDDGRARRASARPPERGVRPARHDRPAVRHAEDGRRASTARRPRATAPRGGSPARPRAPTSSACAPGPTRSSWARARRSPTTPRSPSATPELADARPPLRVVVDAAGRVPLDGHLFDGSAPTLVATTDLRAAGRASTHGASRRRGARARP